MNASGPIVQASIRGLTSGPRRFFRRSYAWRPDRDTVVDLNYPFPHCDLLQQEAHLFLRERSRRQCHRDPSINNQPLKTSNAVFLASDVGASSRETLSRSVARVVLHNLRLDIAQFAKLVHEK